MRLTLIILVSNYQVTVPDGLQGLAWMLSRIILLLCYLAATVWTQTDGGGVIDGLFVAQKNIASGGTYPLPWANGTVAGNAVAAYSGTAIKSTGLPSIVKNCVVAGLRWIIRQHNRRK